MKLRLQPMGTIGPDAIPDVAVSSVCNAGDQAKGQKSMTVVAMGERTGSQSRFWKRGAIGRREQVSGKRFSTIAGKGIP